MAPPRAQRWISGADKQEVYGRWMEGAIQQQEKIQRGKTNLV